MAGTSHADIAAYVLGVLDQPDHVAFEAHLMECERCQDELLELQDVPCLLDEVKQSWPTTPKAPAPRSPDDWTPETSGHVSLF
ncbi:anti-sigma factor family protein [Amycolatopsis aidingensis]|uniref:anti-sigma factor family protein n=1 Tax=Amycolatopsis aidingensis TaxID=2842453 RepID=UPI001C0E8AB9|nr:zf-HC2 domain-containing protein [Amycolatopsis aidingensis]